MNDVRVCAVDGEPLVFTFEFPGAEWFCVTCGGHEDLFGARAEASPEIMRRLDALTDQYERDRAERLGIPYVRPRRAGDDGVPVLICVGCGATPPTGTTVNEDGKPLTWYGRVRGNVHEYACSRDCIPSTESVMPW